MVAQITTGSAVDRNGVRFRRRNARPGIIVLAVLVVLTLTVWTVALTRPEQTREVAACNPPPDASPGGPAGLGERVSTASIIDLAPARLADTRVRVLNASGQGGQASDVAGALRDLGFGPTTAANDPEYPGARLTCQGQIRFGAGGRAGAAAVWLVAPCTELYQDGRPGDGVDLAIGSDFTDLSRNDDIDAALAALRPDATQPADPALLRKIHTGSC